MLASSGTRTLLSLFSSPCSARGWASSPAPMTRLLAGRQRAHQMDRLRSRTERYRTRRAPPPPARRAPPTRASTSMRPLVQREINPGSRALARIEHRRRRAVRDVGRSVRRGQRCDAQRGRGGPGSQRQRPGNGHPALVFHGYSGRRSPSSPALQWGTGDFLMEAVATTTTTRARRKRRRRYEQHDVRLVRWRSIRYRFGEVVSENTVGLRTGSFASSSTTGPSRSSESAAGRYRRSGEGALRAFYLEEPRGLGFRRKGSVLEMREGGVVTATMPDASANTDISAVGAKLYVGGRPNLTHFVGAVWEIARSEGLRLRCGRCCRFEAYAKAKYAL